MTTLYKRASPPQRLVLRIVEGAVKNAHDAHGLEFSPQMARSIAKRAAGTLTAAWPDVLAAVSTPSDRAGSDLTGTPRSGSELAKGRARHMLRMASKRGASATGRAPLRRVWKQLSYLAGQAKANPERLEAIRDALRLVAAVQRETA